MRAEAAADRLVGLAAGGEDVLVLAHGFFNAMIARVLKRRGWRLTVFGLVLAGWESEAGHPAANVPYWDAVAALSSPPDMGWVAGTIADQGRPDLDDGPLLTARRDAFLRQALRGLAS